MTLTWVFTALVPQITTRSDFAISRGSRPAMRPVPAANPAIGRIDADGGMKAGIFLGVAQPVDAVAHHQAHRPGIIVRPHGLRAVARSADKNFSATRSSASSQEIRREFARAFGTVPPQRMHETAGVMLHARHSARPSRRSRRRCSCCPWRRARGRRCVRRSARPRARRSTDSRADRRMPPIRVAHRGAGVSFIAPYITAVG